MTNKFIKNDFKMSKSDLFAADAEFGGCCIQKNPPSLPRGQGRGIISAWGHILRIEFFQRGFN